ncbi:hypothetical protein WJX75_005848 [Coccomyxa subellipsoidea]|uniref:Uncharacterized protein n=1 Tax=Coccomyxa subellipsoidea TaxID=248742 RepID=A0ABR2YAK2_9CHLO
MIGYCTKDLHEPHHKMVKKGVFDDDMELGHEQYLLYGADHIENRVPIDLYNFWPRLHLYSQYSATRPLGESLERTVTRMMQSGKYYPSAKWVVPAAGRGMVLAKAQA